MVLLRLLTASLLPSLLVCCAAKASRAETIMSALLFRISLTLVVLLLCSHVPADAEVIHFRMTGQITVDFVQGNLPAGISEGAPFQADLSYDTATPDSQPSDPQRGLYQATVSSNHFLHFQAGQSEISANDLWLWVGNNVDQVQELWEFKDDAFRMFNSQLTANFPLPTFHSVVFQWLDPSRNALQSDSLPLGLRLEDFQDTWIQISTGSLNIREDQFTIRGIVTEITIVPEPTALQLSLACAIGALVHWQVNLRRSPSFRKSFCDFAQ
jgi:hypothetical protein